MEENKDKKSLFWKTAIEKTFNAGQIKQSFSHGRSRSVSVEVKKKRTLSNFKEEENRLNEVPSSEEPEKSLVTTPSKQEAKQQVENTQKKEAKENINDKKSPKKNFPKQFDSKPELDEKSSEKDKKNKTPKFIKTPKSFENRRQGKLTISQALNDDNEKVRSLAAVKRAREKAKLRNLSSIDLKESSEKKEKKKGNNNT